MQFRTQIPIPESNFPIGYESKMVSLGSCFAVNMAEKFDYYQFQNTVNPFGILFHPIAIEKLLSFVQTQKQFTATDVFFHNERWHSFDTHSDLSDPNQQDLLDKLNNAVASAHQHLSEASHLIITYGTAWVYRENTTQATVANCHKVPQAQFSKEILSVENIRKSIKNSIDSIRKINPNAQIIFTISPVRHLKDGFVENQRSKSNLISALHDVLPLPDCSYFPSYEITMDELRDYRFYAQDMIHLNQVAIDYIWERFIQTHLSESALPILDQVVQIRKGLSHRPFNAGSESHRAFASRLEQSIKTLRQRFPHMQF